MVNAALLVLQGRFPYPGKVSRLDKTLLVVNGLFIGAGIFANLAFEQIGLDLLVVALLALLALEMLRERGQQPLVLYYLTAYWVGLVFTGLVKLAQ
jgi:hypothetical protein